MAQRLPVPGSDDSTWGDILNGFLGVVHNSDGTLKSGLITTNEISSSAGITKIQLASAVQASLSKADTAVQNTGNETIAGIKTFSNSPSAPTPALADNSTSLATTAFVNSVASQKFTVPQNYSGSATWLRIATVTAISSVGSDLSFTIGSVNNWASGRSTVTVTFGCYGSSSSSSYGSLRTTFLNSSDGQSSFYTRQTSAMVWEIWLLQPSYQTTATMTILGGYNYVINLDSSSTSAPTSPSPVAASQITDVNSLAPLASPALTGAPTAPNQADGARDTTIANTNYVRRSLDLYGIGTNAYDLSNTDLNNIGGTGFYKGNGLSNAPASGWWFIEHIRHDDSWATQTATGFTDYAGRTFTRMKYNGSWGVWQEVYKSNGADFYNGTDFNNQVIPGAYRGNNAAGSTNGPGGYGWGILMVSASMINVGIVQTWYPDGAARMYVRTNWGGGWSSWKSTILNDTSNDGYSGITLMNGGADGQSGNNYVVRSNRAVTANFSIYCNNAFGTSVGTIAQIPDGWRPTRGNAEVSLRTSGGATVWASIGTGGYVDWRPGGTAPSGSCPAGQTMYGGCTYIS